MASIGSDVVESFFDVGLDRSGQVYKLGKIEYHKTHKASGACSHSSSDSSWVSQIGLCVLEGGGIGVYAKFWDGGEIAYVFTDDDAAITAYQDWKRARSKGKFIKNSHLMTQDYVNVSLGGFSGGQVKRSPSARTRKQRAAKHPTNLGKWSMKSMKKKGKK